MVKIEEGTKLDFSDVLIKPKRSTIKSRSEVDLNRTFKTLHSKENGQVFLLWLLIWILQELLKCFSINP